MNDKPVCENCLVLPMCLKRTYAERIGRCSIIKSLIRRTVIQPTNEGKFESPMIFYLQDGHIRKQLEIRCDFKEIKKHSSLRSQKGFKYEVEYSIVDNRSYNEVSQALWLAMKTVKCPSEIILEENWRPEIIIRKA